MPQAVVVAQGESVSGLCVRALTAGDTVSLSSELRAAAIANVHTFFSVLHAKFGAHLGTLAPACVELAQTQAAPAQVRRAALCCLLEMCDLFPFSRLFPVKKAVLKGLQGALDDRKKAVRLLAAKVRNAWSVLEK